ncbi:MAG: lipid A biosynthesis acyltransferase, partial [Pseudomonadota bacterium]|nr:lipid A biosynthesis acyltransferase [Pseudomonadota bacterium]
MTQHTSTSTSYRLIKLISRQPIQLGRFFAKLLAALFNTF